MITDIEFIKLHNKQIIDFTISKDLKNIAYVYGNFDLPHILYSNDIRNREIHILDIEKGVDTIKFIGLDQHAPSWSNDGKNLAFLSLLNKKTQLSIYNFEVDKIIFSTSLQYNTENAFYGVKSKDLLWSKDDGLLIIPYFENGKNYYTKSNCFSKSILVIDLRNFTIKQHLSLKFDYRIYDIIDSNSIVYSNDRHLFLYDIITDESIQTKRSGHDIIKFIKGVLFYIDVINNTVIFGVNEEVIIEKYIEGDLIKPIEISNDGLFAIFVVYKKMSVFLIKIKSSGEFIYLSKENELTFYSDSFAEPKIINDKVIFVKSSNKIYFEFFESNKQISFFNNTIIDKLDIEIITKKYKSGENIIETVILFPENYNNNKHYPALIYIHGGPNTFETMTIDNLISARGKSVAIELCQEGFIVALPNYRGTKGYGYKHLEKVPSYSMDYADYVFEDIMNCKEMLVQKYNVDKNKVGLYGSSFGAQITGWIITNNKNFYAAAGIIGVRYDDEKYSVETKVESIDCPFLIIETGMAEGRFHIGENLYNKLLSHNKITEYYIYSNAFHNGGWNDDYKLDYIKRITTFFKKYL